MRRRLPRDPRKWSVKQLISRVDQLETAIDTYQNELELLYEEVIGRENSAESSTGPQ